MKYRQMKQYEAERKIEDRIPLDKPVIGFLTPCFNVGGVERWLITLSKFIPEYRFVVGLTNPKLDPIAVEEFGGIVTTEVDKVVSASDLLLSWTDFLPNTQGKDLVHVVHGDTEWSARCAKNNEPFVTEYVRVGKVAAPTPRKAKLIKNGIDFSRFSTLKEISKRNRRTFCYVGRYSPEKNPLFAVREARKYDAKLLFCSPNPPKDEILSIWPDVEFFKPDQVEYVFKNSDLAILKSRNESFGFVFLEALYCGCPIVANNVGILKDYFWPFKIHYDSVSQVLRGGQRYKPDLKKYSAEVMASKYRKLFDGICGY